MRLLAAGIRPISNVVDASNYVMVELGKPVHTYDAAALAPAADGVHEIVVRAAREGETIETIDHVTRTLTTDTLLIADAKVPIGIAGVMGGAGTEVSDATTKVIVESAIFDPVNIRRTAFRYALRSDASLRFEKGQEFRLARLGADRTARLVTNGRVDERRPASSIRTRQSLPRVAWRSGRPGSIACWARSSAPRRSARSSRASGSRRRRPKGRSTSSSPRDRRPESVAAAAGEAILATVPTWRRDIEIEADLAEEIARVHGYERIPGHLPATPMPEWRETPLATRDAIRAALTGAGLTEAVSYALVSSKLDETFAWLQAARPARGEAAREGGSITVSNPLSSDHSILRQTLIGSLVEVVQRNLRHGNDDVLVFEVGKGYGRLGDDTP